MNQQQMKITPEMVKNGTNIKCEGCGNLIFVEKVIFKKIAAVLSPSGKIEVIPTPIIVCDNCGKVSEIFDPQKIVPKELKVVKLSPKTNPSNNLKIQR